MVWIRYVALSVRGYEFSLMPCAFPPVTSVAFCFLCVQSSTSYLMQ